MSTTLSSFLNSILLEVAIDDRVPNGTVDFGNSLHLSILAEKMVDRGIDRQSIVEAVNKLALQDGKYPDRQAYNKDGWLVTFPTPEHKAAAIKNRTHFGSDPTHGQGGMNLYYKSKGKQSRQRSQGSSEVGGETGEPVDQKSQQKPSEAPTSDQGGSNSLPPSNGAQPAKNVGGGSAEKPTSAAPTGDTGELPPSDQSGGNDVSNATGTNQSATPAQPTTPVAPQSPQTTNASIVKISIEFAQSKQWKEAPYGDWTNDHGDQIAVTGLDGQVVPIKYVDREELKSFADKKMTEGIDLREALQRVRSNR